MEHDMLGRVVAITGANTGIGKATAVALARRGATVLLCCRNLAKADAALAEVRAAGNGDAKVIELDLADLAAVRRSAATILDTHSRLDVLINNAGVLPVRRQTSADGYELQFAVNHLGHFLLTNLLLERLLAVTDTPGMPRVVNVSSVMHKRGRLDLATAVNPVRYNALRVYSQSKLANVLFTRELAKRYGARGLRAFAVHPGPVATEIYRDIPQPLRWLVSQFLLTAQQGARTSIWCATSRDLDHTNGSYFAKCRPTRVSAAAQNDHDAEQLWQHSLTWTGMAGKE